MRKLLLLCLLLSLTGLFAQEAELDVTTLSKKDVLKYLDERIEVRDENLVEFMGMLGVDFPDYAEFEEYLLNRASDLIQSEDITYPLTLVEAVLYNNLENSRAQELYSVLVDKQIEITERREAEERKAELKRITIESEEALEIEEQLKEEEEISQKMYTVKDLSGVINSFSDSFHRTRYTTNSYFYPIYFRHYFSQVYDDYVGREYTYNTEQGFAVDIGLGIELNFITIRLDATCDMSYELLFNNYDRQIFSSGVLSLGFSFIPIPLFLRGGFYYDKFIFIDEDDINTAVLTLPSPSAGIGITGWRFLKVFKFDLSADYLFASTYTKNLDLALVGKSYLSINMFRIGAMNFELKGGLDYLFLYEGGLREDSFMPKFGLGVGNYE